MNRYKLALKNLRKILLGFVVACIILSLFVIRGYRVSSDSMQSTISKGKFLAVNKLSYGARIPITWLSLPFIWKNHYSRIIEFPYLRFPAISNIDMNDILLFNNPQESDPPIDKKAEIIARVIALPGDTLRIENKRVFI